MKRALWIFNHYAGFPETVPATRTFELARLLVARDWDVTVVAAGFNHYRFEDDCVYPAGGVLEKMRDGVRWVFLKTVPYRTNGARRLLNMLSYSRRARRWAERQPGAPQVIIGTTVHPFAADTARRIAAASGAPFCYEITDLWPETLVDLGALRRGSLPYRYLARLERKAFEAAAGVIGLLPGIAAYARDVHALEIPRFCYAPNGISGRPVPGPSPSPWEAGRVVWAGGFAAAHGLDCVLVAAEYLERRSPGVFRFDLYGDGPERAQLHARAAAQGLANVAFRGWVAKRELARALASAEICLCTARPMAVHRYGISMNKLFDYFALAKPVVCAVDAARNPVVESGAGVTVPAGDGVQLAQAIERIHALPAEARHAMGMRGYEFLRREHVFDVIADRLDRFLGTVSR